MKKEIKIIDIKTVEFYEDEIISILVEIDGEKKIYSPIKTLSKNLGIDYSGQLQKIKNDNVLKGGMEIISIPVEMGNGIIQNQKMQCLNHKLIPIWMTTINSSKIKPQYRDKLDKYKLEAAEALYEIFMGKGFYINQDPNKVDENRLEGEFKDIQEIKMKDRQQRLDAIKETPQFLLDVIDTRFLARVYENLVGEGVEKENEIFEVTTYLKSKGLQEKQIRELRKSFGGLLAKEFKRKYGKTPKKLSKEVNGNIRKVNYYEHSDLPFIESVFEEFALSKGIK